MKRKRILVGWLGWLVLVGAVGAELPLPAAGQTQPAIEKPGRQPESVATWNLQWFPGNRPQASSSEKKRHQRQVADVIRKLDADLLLLQEVVDAPALAETTLAYPWRVVSSFQRAGDEDPDLPPQNVAILSKVPIRESWEVGFHSLPLTPDRPVRGFLGVRLGTKKNGITVYTVHLKSNRGGREASAPRRERALEYLRRDWKKRGLDPQKDRILIGGDFNCSLRNPEFADEKTLRGLFQDGWISAAQDIPWPDAATVKPDPKGKYPTTDFDHLILSPAWVALLRSGPQKGLSYTGFKAGVMQDPRTPSDHYPVWMRWGD